MIGKLKRTLAMALVLCMVFSLCPVSALAEAPEEGEHSYVAGVSTASCMADGLVTYTCSTCGDSYDEVAAATGHSYVEGEKVEATCTEDGSVAMSCSACGDSYTDILPAGHKFTEGVCTLCGAPENEGQAEDKPELSGQVTPLYFYNEEGWAKVYAAWSFDEEAFADLMLPGIEMTETALAGVWAVNVPVEADAIIFNNGMTGAEERKAESLIPAEGDLYAQGMWQYSYAFTAPLAANGSFVVSAKGSGTVSVDGNAVTGSEDFAAGQHSIKVAPAYDEGYYIKSLIVNGAGVALTDDMFPNGAKGAYSFDYNLKSDEKATIEVEFAKYSLSLRGGQTLYIDLTDGWSKIPNITSDANIAAFKVQVLAALVGGDAASHPEDYKVYMVMNTNPIGTANIQDIEIASDSSFATGINGFFGLAGAMSGDDSESYAVEFLGNDRYPPTEKARATATSFFEPTATINASDVTVKVARTSDVSVTLVRDALVEAGASITVSEGSQYGKTQKSFAVDFSKATVTLGTMSDGSTSTRATITVPASVYPEATKTVTVTIEYLPEYTVIWDGNNGTEPTTAVVLKNGTSGTISDFEIPVYSGETPTKAADAKYSYSFNGWGSPVINDDYKTITYTASYTATPVKHTVTFNTDGGSAVAPITADYGAAITAPAAPTKEGYTFAGWDADIPATMPEKDMTITAKWTVNRYTVTFNTDGGSAVAPITADYGAAITTPAAPTKEGHTFDGWDKEIPATMPAGNLTITAKWTVNQYTITFDTDGGSVVAPITADYGSAITTPAAPTKEGHTFAGWDAEIPATMPAKNMTVTANWTINQYTVIFENEDGTVLQSSKVTYGEIPVYSGETPTKAATAEFKFAFAGWDKTLAAVTGDITYTATFSSATEYYTITFANADGTVLESKEWVYGATPSYNGIPTKAADAQYSYSFKGWSPAIAAVTGDATYTASYDAILNEYTVIFKNEDGTVLQSSKVTYGEIPAYSGETPTKAADVQYCYSFKGWSPDIAAVTGEITYTATYDSSVNEHTITFENEDGTVLQSGKVAYGETPVYSGETPTKAADAQYSYSFKGWSPDIATVAGEATYTATYDSTLNKYNVTFADGSIESNVKAEYGSTVAAPAVTDTDADDRVFLGWYDSKDELYDFSAAVTGDLRLTAKWAEDINNNGIDDSSDTRYTVTYDYDRDGVENHEEKVLVGLATPTINDPKWSKHVFLGWSPAVAGTVTGDAIYTALWADDENENGADDSTETSTIILTVTGEALGSVELSDNHRNTYITKNVDGSYTVLFDSKSEGANVITVTATPKDTDGSDGSADYVDSQSHQQLAVENDVTHNVTVAFASRGIAASNGEIFINRFEAGNALTDNAAAKAITGALREDILEAAGLDANEPYIVTAKLSYQGYNIDVVVGKNGIEGDLSIPDLDPDQAAAYALSRLNDMDVKISLAEDGKLPAVEKAVEITVKEARPAAVITLGKTLIELGFDKATEVEDAAEKNVSVSYGTTPITAWTLDADKTAEELMTGEVQTITYKVTVAETASYTGAEASFTVKATHKTYEPIISLSEATDDGDAAYSISGSTVTVTAAPNEGCYVESVVCTLDGESVALTGSYAADRSYTCTFETELGNDAAKEYKVVVSYGKRSIAKNSSIPSLTYNEDEETLLKAVYAAIVDEANSEGGIAYGKVSLSVNKTVTGAGTYEFTVTWEDDSVANKYPSVTAKAEIVLTNELILAPAAQQSLTAEVVDGEIVLTEQDILAAVDAGNVPDSAGLEKTLIAPSVSEINAALTAQGNSVDVTVKVTAGGQGTPYDPAEAEVTLTITAPVNHAVITVEDYENGSLKINGVLTAAGSASYVPGLYTVELKGSGKYVPNTLVISLDGEELQSLVGEASAEFTVIDGTGKALDYVPEYTVAASFAIAGVKIPGSATMNYYVGMENTAQQLEQFAMQALENAEGGVVYTPADLKEGAGKLSYRAREAKTYTYVATIDPREYGIGFIPAQTVEVPVEAEELWLNLGESFVPAAEPTQEQIKAIVDRVINTYGINALMSMYENDKDQLIAILKAEIMKDPVFVNYYNFYGAHRFGDDVTNTELVKLTVDSDKYGVLESNTSLLTLDDTRTETEISANTGVEMVYGFTAEELLAALGAKVTGKDGADLGQPQIETDVEAMCASGELQTVKLFYPGTEAYRRCSAEVQILVKRASVNVFVDNRLIRWQEGLSYELPVGTDPAGVDTITFIAGLNVAGADIDAGAIGSGNPVVGLRGDIVLLIPDALSSALAYVGIPSEGYMTLGELRSAILELADISGLAESTNEAVAQLMTMLESISDDKLDVGVHIGSELPVDIGVYVVGAVSADANYETNFGAGYIIIAPNGVKAKLAWNMTDDNYALTLDKLQSFDLGASAEVIESTLDGATMPGSAQHHLEYLFIGVDDDGELLIDRCTDPNSVELGMGVYSQVAYIANWGNAMYYAEPIARPIIVTPNVADVAILDQNGNENYAQLLTYDGNAKAVTVTVDGKTVTEGLTVKYIGSDLTADGWYRDAAPTNAGAYTVVAIYTEKDAEGKLVKAGAAVAGIVIKPADADITLNDAEYSYDAGEHFADIANTGFDYVTLAVDRANNTVYVNLPDDMGAHLQRLSDMLPAAAKAKLDAFLAKYESFDGDVQSATVCAELVELLNTVIAADTSAAAEAKAKELAEAIVEKLANNEEIKAAYAKLKAELAALKNKVGDKIPDEIEAKLEEYLKKVISIGEEGADIDIAKLKEALYAKVTALESKLPAAVVSKLHAMVDELIAVVEANLDKEAIEAEINELVATLKKLDAEDAKTAVKYVLGAIYGYADMSELKAFVGEAYARIAAQDYIDYAKSMINSLAGLCDGIVDVSGVEAAIEALAADVKAKIESGSLDADDLDALERDVDAILQALADAIGQVPNMTAVFGKNPSEVGEYDCFIVNVSKNYTPELARASLVIKPAEVTVTMDSHDLALNDEIPELTYTIEGLVGDDTLTVTPSCDITDTSVEGSYTVTASVSEDPHYVVTVIDGTITVTEKRSPVTITAKEDAEVETDSDMTLEELAEALEITVTDAEGNAIEDYELVIKNAEGNVVDPADLVAGETYTAVITFKGSDTQAPAEKEISFTAVSSREGLFPIDLSGNTVGVDAGSVVEVDGVKYTVEEDCLVWVSETTHKIVVSYNWASSTSTVEPNYDGGTGPHYDYPSNMYVWYLTFEDNAYTAERIEDLDDFLSYKGTSIRMTGNQGIRIFTAVNEANRAKLINGTLISHHALEGYKLVEYGTLFAMAEKYSDLTLDNGARSFAYSTAQGRDAIFSRSGSDIWYTGMLVDLELELCDDELLIRPYMIIEGPDGEQLTIYGGTLQRTIGYVALQNREYKPTQAAHEFIWNIIYAVYGEDFEYNF